MEDFPDSPFPTEQKIMKRTESRTYAVYGMMEWHALIPARENVVRVNFTGGSISGYGVRPATFTTSNEVLQHLIENSAHFRNGRIKIL